ncbi:MAG: 30S ribosomal protein S2 [Acidobacteria bacterium]|nr:30S ribosomal protein S2 [Acidobacteriota bacterium]
MVSITMKQLLEAGVHFGHQTKRWNPKMKEYIFGQRNGIYIIDLQKSIRLFKSAIQFMYDLGSQGKTILFLGTKRQAQEAIQEAAQKTSTYYVNQRWLGGLLTNFVTIQKSIKRFRELETMRSNGQYDLFSKKEVARYERERKKLEKNLSGIKDMTGLPDALFVIDTKLETIAIKEAVKLGIPVVGVADTNCDPDEIDYIIPGNDDALRAIRLITDTIAQAYLDGKAVYEAQQKELAEQMEKQRQIQAKQAAAAREAAEKAAAAAADTKAPATDQTDAATVPDGQGSSADENAGAAESAAKPKTTMRKTLQRKAKTKKTEVAATPAESAPADPAPVESAPADPAPAESAPADPAKDVKSEEEKEEPTEVKDAKSEDPGKTSTTGQES